MVNYGNLVMLVVEDDDWKVYDEPDPTQFLDVLLGKLDTSCFQAVRFITADTIEEKIIKLQAGPVRWHEQFDIFRPVP